MRLCHYATTALCMQNDNGARSLTDTELFPTSEQIERKPTASFEKALIKIRLLPCAVLSASSAFDQTPAVERAC